MPQGKFVFSIVVVLGFLSRLLPHPDNFTPIIAMSLLAGAYAGRAWLAVLLPLLAMALSDLVLNNTIYASYYDGFAGIQSLLDNGFSYIALALLALMPLLIPARLRSMWSTLFGLGLGGTVLFFVLSNFGTWLGSPMYAQSPAGLLACMLAGVPFFPATLLSTLLYGAIATIALKTFGVQVDERAEEEVLATA